MMTHAALDGNWLCGSFGLYDLDKSDWIFFLYISAVKENCLPINSLSILPHIAFSKQKFGKTDKVSSIWTQDIKAREFTVARGWKKSYFNCTSVCT